MVKINNIFIFVRDKQNMINLIPKNKPSTLFANLEYILNVHIS